MKQFVCVFDFETDDTDPKTCEPVQLAGLMLSPQTLEIMEGSEFCIDMRPSDIDDEDYFTKHTSTINFHAKNYETTPENIYKKWKASIEQSTAWNQWIEYLSKWNKNQSNKTIWTAPIRAGHNIRNFDIPIMDRLCTKYKHVQKTGEQKIFYPRDVVDIKELAFYWFEHLPEPKAYNMRDLRIYFGLSTEGSHDALVDIRDEAWMISRFLKLHRSQALKVKFKGSANKNDD